MSPETWQRVLRLNRFGDRPQPLILASMYRHLAHAPAFLQRLETVLAPVQADGSLDRAISANRAGRRASGRVCWRGPSRPSGRHWPAKIETGVSAFVDHAIGKMVTICRAIRVARDCHPERSKV